MRLVFAGTPQVAATTLARLLQAGEHEVLAVVTRPDAAQGRSSALVPSPVAQLASQEGIEVLRPERASNPRLAERLAELAPDCCPVVAYGGLIPPALLGLPRLGWVNVHYSLLPRWRGAAPVQHAILAGDEVTGVTVFELVEQLDAGPVLGQAEYRLGPDETAGEALAALTELGAGLLLTILTDLAAGTLTAKAQPEEGITLAPKLSQASARLDWSLPAEQLARQIRAGNPALPAWSDHAGARLRILTASAVPGEELAPGEIQVSKRWVLVGTGSDALRLGEIQPAGKKPMAAVDWGRGLRGPGRLQ